MKEKAEQVPEEQELTEVEVPPPETRSLVLAPSEGSVKVIDVLGFTVKLCNDPSQSKVVGLALPPLTVIVA